MAPIEDWPQHDSLTRAAVAPMANDASAALGTPEIAGTLTNPGGFVKKAVVREGWRARRRRRSSTVYRDTRSLLRVGVLVIAAIAAGLLAAASAGAASNGQIAMVDSDAEAGLSAILLIPTDRLATRANSKVLVSGPGTISNIQWTPDGKTLVYDEFTRNRTDLYAVDVANHKRRLLVANLPGGTNGALSPDGKTIAYWLESGLSLTVYLVGTDGQSRRKLTAGFDPVWSSDSSRLALVTTAGRIETIGADGSGPQTTGRVTDPAGRAIDPSLITTFAWAPDGQSFLVAYFGGPLTASVIETIASDGRVLRVLSKTGDVAAKWSPDGTEIAFTENAAKNRETAVVVNATGSGRHAVDTPPGLASDALELSWSPDGRSIVTADGDRVRVVDADGTHAMVIAYPGDGHDLSDPSWQPLP